MSVRWGKGAQEELAVVLLVVVMLGVLVFMVFIVVMWVVVLVLLLLVGVVCGVWRWIFYVGGAGWW